MKPQDLKSRIDALNQRVNKAVGAADHSAMANFLAAMMAVPVTSHLMHFATPSRSDHLALEALYSGLPGLLDSVAEGYMGLTRSRIPMSAYTGAAVLIATTDPLTYVENLQDYVASARQSLPQASQLQNRIDEVAGLIDDVAYQLRELK